MTLALEIRQTYAGMMVAIPAGQWAVFNGLSAEEMAGVLRAAAAQMVLTRYAKHPRGPKKKPPPRGRYENGAHVSTAKILAARKG